MIVEVLLFQVAAPSVAAAPRRLVEALAAPLGESMACESGPVPATELPPQDARERGEEGPEGRTEPDAAQLPSGTWRKRVAGYGQEHIAMQIVLLFS